MESVYRGTCVSKTYSKGATYIICVMGYAWSASSRIPTISRTVYNYFN